MKQASRKGRGVAIVVAATLLASLTVPSVAVYAAATKGVAQDQHQLPILKVTPSDGATVVRPDAPIQIVLDPNADNYKRFYEQFAKGFYELTLNGQTVQSVYDDKTHTITVAPMMLNRYTAYTLTLTLKAMKNSDTTQSGNAAYSYRFQTGSALHEATHLETHVEQSPVRVTDGGQLDVKVTDDYGLPATNATIHVTGDSSTFSAPDLTITADGNGQGIIPLTDHTKETVHLTVTAQDTTFHDTNDTTTSTATEQFIAGAPDHLTVQADSPLTVGETEHVTGTVYDVYNNTVEDGTIVTLTPSAGSVNATSQQTKNGTYDFEYTATTTVQDITLTAQDAQANGTAQIKLQAAAPAKMTVNTSPTSIPADGQTTSTTTLTVTDAYGNPVPNTVITLSGQTNAQFPATVTTDSNGQATFTIVDGTSETVVLTATTTNNVQGTITVQCNPVAPPITSEDVVTWEVVKQPDGSLVITGSVIDHRSGQKCPGVLVPIDVTGGSLGSSTVITDDDGNFRVVVYPSGGGSTVISIPIADNKPQIVYYGSSGSTSELNVHETQIIRIVNDEGAGAQMGGGGATVPLGSDTTFTAGSGGNMTVSYGPDTIIYLEDECDHFGPVLQLTATPNAMFADGKSTSVIKGRLLEESKAYMDTHQLVPVVNATVTLELLNHDGTLSQTQVTTDANGYFQTTYTAGTTAGQVPVKATWGELSQTVTITLGDYTGTTPPSNVDDPVILDGDKPTTVDPGEAFRPPSMPYDANNYVPFFYWSQFPVIDPNSFDHSVTRAPNGGMWLNQAPYGGASTPNGLMFYRTTFHLDSPATVQFSFGNVDDVGLAYIDSQPIAYNNDINYTSGFTSKGISLPPTSKSATLSAGDHTLIIEAANAYHPGSGNFAGVNFTAQNTVTRQVLATSSNPATWTTTGYVSTPPTSWYYTPGTYMIAEELLNYYTLQVADSSKWVVNVTP